MNHSKKNGRKPVNELHLFAGKFGGGLGGMLLGHTTVCAVEIETDCRRTILQRQRDNILPRFPIWDDVCTFDGRPWRGLVDILCGGFPCQDLSIANPGGEGLDGSRSGLWSEMVRIIGEVRPKRVFVENSSQLVGRGLARVISDLAKMGYVNARWCVLGGHSAGSISNGERVWIVADEADSIGWTTPELPNQITCQEKPWRRQFKRAISACASNETDTEMRGNPDALARGMERLKGIGNGQDPILAATAYRILTQPITSD